MRRVAGLVAAICLLFAPERLRAQSADATLTGAVKDTSGASIPGATITVRHTATNETRTGVAGPEGPRRRDRRGDHGAPTFEPAWPGAAQPARPGRRKQVASRARDLEPEQL